MNQILSPLPITFVLTTLIIFLVASFFTIKLHKRISQLNQDVRKAIDRGATLNSLPILEELERRYGTASKKLEQQVNTPSLVNSIYSNQKLGKLSYQDLEYGIKVAPNLLISIGLLGTFLGITLNLINITEALNNLTNNLSEIGEIIDKLKVPLEGMGVAFISSLMALFFSMILTIVNSIFNITQAKNKLLDSLEDYLDNIYQGELQANSKTRFDDAVDRMAENFDNFLDNFGNTVRDSVESATRGTVERITDAYTGVTDLAEQVYSKFGEAATTISRSANDIETSANLFKKASDTLSQTDFAKLLAESTEQLNTIELNFRRSTDNLSNSMSTIQLVVSKLEESSDKFVSVGEEIRDVNKLYVQIGTIQESNQKSLQEIIPELKLGAETLTANITKLEAVQEVVNNRSDSLRDVQHELTQLVININTYTENLTKDMLKMREQIVSENTNTNESINNLGRDINQTSNNLITLIEQINELNQTTVKVYQSIENNQTSLAEVIPEIGKGAQYIGVAVSRLQEFQSETYQKYDSFESFG